MSYRSSTINISGGSPGFFTNLTVTGVADIVNITPSGGTLSIGGSAIVSNRLETQGFQGAFFGNAGGVYTTWGTASPVGDIGTGNVIIGGGSASDFALNVRGANILHLCSGDVSRVAVNASGAAVTGSISATTGVSTGNTGSVALTIPNNTGIRSADTSGTGTAFIDVANLTVRNPNAAFAPIFDTFAQGVAVTGYIAGAEQTAPAAPAANGYRIFAQDNGAGKTQLMVIFASGAAQQLAIEP